MNRFAAAQLDLSRLPPPDALRDIDFEVILAARLARLQPELARVGIAWDVGSLETDSAVIIEENDAYREMLGGFAINDAVRAGYLAFAEKADLDQLAANFGVFRLAAESDERLRRRVQLAPDAYGAAGSEGAYIFWALSADVRIFDAAALGYGSPGRKPGEVNVRIAAPADVAADALVKASAKLFDRDIKPLTDILTVGLAPWKRYRVKAVIEIPRGPDRALAQITALEGFAKYAADRRRAGALIAWSGIAKALHVDAAERVIIESPETDIDPGPGGLAVCEAIEVTTRVLN